jgi:hypothetical protein
LFLAIASEQLLTNTAVGITAACYQSVISHLLSVISLVIWLSAAAGAAAAAALTKAVAE